MPRLIAALLVVCTAFMLVSAQDDGERKFPRPFGGQKSQLPFDTVDIDGKTAWKVAGRGAVRVEELIAGLATATRQRFTYTSEASRMRGNSVPYVGPDEGVIVENAELADYVSELIEAGELTLVGHSRGKGRVASMRESHAYALFVEPASLGTLPASEWVSVRAELQHSDADVIRGQFRHFDRRQDFLMIQADASSVSISGRVSQVQNIWRQIQALDKPGASRSGAIVKTYTLPESTKAEDAKRVIESLFDEGSSTVTKLDGAYSVETRSRSRVNVAVAGNNKLIVRAQSADQALVQSAIDALR